MPGRGNHGPFRIKEILIFRTDGGARYYWIMDANLSEYAEHLTGADLRLRVPS